MSPVSDGYEVWRDNRSSFLPVLVDLDKKKLVINWNEDRERHTVCNYELNSEGLLVKPFKIGRFDHTHGDFYSEHPLLISLVREWDTHIEGIILGHATE
jgi:hypothetical protein